MSDAEKIAQLEAQLKIQIDQALKWQQYAMEFQDKLRVAEEALQFYADPKNYIHGSMSEACCDNGETAAEALAKIREGKK